MEQYWAIILGSFLVLYEDKVNLAEETMLPRPIGILRLGPLTLVEQMTLPTSLVKDT